MRQSEPVPQPKFPESKLAVFLKEIYGIWISERPTQFAAALRQALTAAEAWRAQGD